MGKPPRNHPFYKLMWDFGKISLRFSLQKSLATLSWVQKSMPKSICRKLRGCTKSTCREFYLLCIPVSFSFFLSWEFLRINLLNPNPTYPFGNHESTLKIRRDMWGKVPNTIHKLHSHAQATIPEITEHNQLPQIFQATGNTKLEHSIEIKRQQIGEVEGRPDTWSTWSNLDQSETFPQKIIFEEKTLLPK